MKIRRKSSATQLRWQQKLRQLFTGSNSLDFRRWRVGGKIRAEVLSFVFLSAEKLVFDREFGRRLVCDSLAYVAEWSSLTWFRSIEPIKLHGK